MRSLTFQTFTVLVAGGAFGCGAAARPDPVATPAQASDAVPPGPAECAAGDAGACCAQGAEDARLLAIADPDVKAAVGAARPGRDAVHRLLRRGELHRGPRELHHRRAADPDGADVGMPAQACTLATALKAQGYATEQFGKNHLGDLNKSLPTLHGFDEFFGYLYHPDAMSDPFWYSFPTDQAYYEKFGPRSLVRCVATDVDDPTEHPRWGGVGR